MNISMCVTKQILWWPLHYNLWNILWLLTFPSLNFIAKACSCGNHLSLMIDHWWTIWFLSFFIAFWLPIQHGPPIDWEERMEFKVWSAEARTSWNWRDSKTRTVSTFNCIIWSWEARGKFEESIKHREAMWGWCMFFLSSIIYMIVRFVYLRALLFAPFFCWSCLHFYFGQCWKS